MAIAAELLDPTTAGVLGAQTLRSSPQQVVIASSPGEILDIRIKARPNDMWKMIVAMFVAAIISFAIMWSLDRFRWADDIPLRMFGRPCLPFMFMGFAFLGLGFVMLLIATTTGPGKDCLLQLAPGRIKIDRYVAGDHIVREYSADEIRRVAVADGAVMIAIPAGEILVGAGLPLELQVSLVAVISVALWENHAALIPNLRVGRMNIPLCACDAASDQ